MSALPIKILNLDALAEMFCFDTAGQEGTEDELYILFRPKAVLARLDVHERVFACVGRVVINGVSWKIIDTLDARTIGEIGDSEYGCVVVGFWVESGEQVEAEQNVVLERRDGKRFHFEKSP